MYSTRVVQINGNVITKFEYIFARDGKLSPGISTPPERRRSLKHQGSPIRGKGCPKMPRTAYMAAKFDRRV